MLRFAPVMAVGLLLSGCWPKGGPPDVETVTMWGVAFTLVPNGEPVADVLIELEELPSYSAWSDAYGRWEMQVPDNATFTPRVTHDDYVTMHIQTLTTAGEDLERVGVQMISPWIYSIFEVDLGVEADDSKCQVSMTVNTIEVRDLELDDFRAFGHHGVAGATIAAEPAVPDIVYFDEATRPTWDLTETTIDGGVVAPNIDPGVYTFTASHAEREFEPFVATCAAGRFINAGPPWGPRERE